MAKKVSSLKLLVCGSAVLWLMHSLINFIRKVPQGDEVDVLLSHEALYHTGNTAFAFDSLGGSTGHWHPPLLKLVIQVFMHLGLDAFQSSLALNLLCGLATMVVTWRMGYHLARHEKLESPSEVGMLGVALLCLIPLFQAGSGIIEIDSGLLTFVMSAYIATILGIYDRVSFTKLFVLGCLLGIMLLAKISTPLICIPFTLAFFWKKEGGIKRALKPASTAIIIGLFVFASIFVITRPLFGGPWYEPFTNNYSLLSTKSQSHSWTGGFFRTAAELFLWIGPPIGLILILSIKKSFWPFKKRFIKAVTLLLLGYVVGICGVYSYLGVTFNVRYMIPTLPALAAIIAFVIIQEEKLRLSIQAQLKSKALVGAVLVLATALLLLPDPILYVKRSLKYDLWNSALYYAVSLLIVCISAYLFLWWLRGKGVITGNLFMPWLLAILIMFNLNTSIKQIAGGYQLGYGYGLKEYDGVVDWLNKNAQNGIPIVASDTFLWFFRDTGHTVYRDIHLDKLVRIHKDKQQPLSYYYVLQRHNPRFTGQAWDEITLGSEEMYQNRDFLVIRKSL